MRRLLKNKIFILAVALLLAGYFSFGLLPKLYQDQADTITVVRLKNDVAAGTQITKDMLTEKTVGSYGLTEEAITDKDSVAGKYAAVDIFAEDNITPTKLSDNAVTVSKDQRLVTISVSSAAAGGGGYLKAGDIVDVMAYNKDTEVVDSGLSGVTVYSVKNDDMEDVLTAKEGKDQIPKYVTLVVTQQQADVLVSMEYSEKIHILLKTN